MSESEDISLRPCCDPRSGTLWAHSQTRSADEIEAEIKWEVHGVEKGRDKYRKWTEGQGAEVMTSIAKLEQRVVAPLSALILVLQNQAVEGLTKRGSNAAWYEPITRLPADEWAVITFRIAARACFDASGGPLAGKEAAAGNLARAIAAAARSQMEFRLITEKPEEGDEEKPISTSHFDALTIIKARGMIAKSSWPKFVEKLLGMRVKPLDTAAQTSLGAVLLKALVDASGGVFRLDKALNKEGNEELRLTVEPEALEILREREAIAEVARPWLLPMIVRPNPWSYDE